MLWHLMKSRLVYFFLKGRDKMCCRIKLYPGLALSGCAASCLLFALFQFKKIFPPFPSHSFPFRNAEKRGTSQAMEPSPLNFLSAIFPKCPRHCSLCTQNLKHPIMEQEVGGDKNKTKENGGHKGTANVFPLQRQKPYWLIYPDDPKKWLLLWLHLYP